MSRCPICNRFKCACGDKDKQIARLRARVSELEEQKGLAAEAEYAGIDCWDLCHDIGVVSVDAYKLRKRLLVTQLELERVRAELDGAISHSIRRIESGGEK